MLNFTDAEVIARALVCSHWITMSVRMMAPISFLPYFVILRVAQREFRESL